MDDPLFTHFWGEATPPGRPDRSAPRTEEDRLDARFDLAALRFAESGRAGAAASPRATV